jgi:hypothetical protein
MCQRFALIGVKQHNTAGFGLVAAKVEPQTNAIPSHAHLAVPSGCVAVGVKMRRETRQTKDISNKKEFDRSQKVSLAMSQPRSGV